jgi:hypothetical protein
MPLEADKETFLLVRSSLPELKDRKLRWVIYLTDKKGNVLSDASAPFGFARSNDVIKELLDLLTGNAKHVGGQLNARKSGHNQTLKSGQLVDLTCPERLCSE